MSYKRNFNINFNVTATLTVDNTVIDRVLNNEDNWKEMFYDLDLEGLIEMISSNMLQGIDISCMDGFADLSYDRVDIFNVDYALESIDEVINK